ncbi:hypothetical protein [Prosthecobacter sp.]|uniref:hypothetical protein n=1 Tax=Prosthecobacter sp. TaxID=1965333 RepID=UPI001DEC9998|nr:hypothetical protein [Prosthecobacter sp.]MCB1278551.1 hypothetical protein [Prosthecobacter sp.]
MRVTAIKKHLTIYSIFGRRKTTINHAFASAISPCDQYSEADVKEAVHALGQDPEADLECVYCGKEAETWDHVFATVENGEFSGAGHRLGNLLPCCKPCNSKKGNRPWSIFMDSLEMSDEERLSRKGTIERYLKRFFRRDSPPSKSEDYLKLLSIRDQVIELLKQGDVIAASIRSKATRSK